MEWIVADKPVPYEAALEAMEAHVAAVHGGTAGERIWLLEHPPLYTAGTSAKAGDLLSPDRFPVYYTGRGGEFTYHGPGQRVAYVMLDLARRGRDVKRFVSSLEQWIIDTLAAFDVSAGRREGRIGIWVDRDDGHEDKIAALGIRIRKWVSFHGIAINLKPDLEHFSGIVPCGISEHGVTSLAELGVRTTMADLDAALKDTFEQNFPPA